MCALCMQEAACLKLLEWGADADLPDNDGVTCKQISRYNPRILAGIHQKQASVCDVVYTTLQDCLQQVLLPALHAPEHDALLQTAN